MATPAFQPLPPILPSSQDVVVAALVARIEGRLAELRNYAAWTAAVAAALAPYEGQLVRGCASRLRRTLRAKRLGRLTRVCAGAWRVSRCISSLDHSRCYTYGDEADYSGVCIAPHGTIALAELTIEMRAAATSLSALESALADQAKLQEVAVAMAAASAARTALSALYDARFCEVRRLWRAAVLGEKPSETADQPLSLAEVLHRAAL